MILDKADKHKADILKFLFNNGDQGVWFWQDEPWRKEFLRKLITISLALIAGYLYYLANHYNAMRFVDTKPFIFKFPIDDYIKFNNLFVIPYYLWYFYIAFTVIMLFLQKNSSLYFKLIFTMAISVFVSCVFYLGFPTYVPRETLPGNDILTQMIKNIYAIDPPFNCFPSMHVLYAYICCWYLLYFRRIGLWFDILNITVFVLITLSTVYTKQHYTPDILGGVVIAGIFCALFTYSDKIFKTSKIK